MLTKIKPVARKTAVALGVMVGAFIYQVSDAIAEPADDHVAKPPDRVV
jgi:hypothetical protein